MIISNVAKICPVQWTWEKMFVFVDEKLGKVAFPFINMLKSSNVVWKIFLLGTYISNEFI